MDHSACLSGAHTTDGWGASRKALPDQSVQSVRSVSQSNGHPVCGSENPENEIFLNAELGMTDPDPFASIPNASDRSDAVL